MTLPSWRMKSTWLRSARLCADDGGSRPGHGTEMAGLALYGDLTPLLAGSMPVVLTHRLETVKILPPRGKKPHPPDNWGSVTALGVSCDAFSV